jgi:drug/metabolite transporter (DMT)-like permease
MRANSREFTIGIACALAVVVLWSSFHLVSRIGVQTSLTPYDLVTLRVGIAGLIMIPVLVRLGLGHLRLWQAVVLALIAGPGFGLTAFSGYQFAPAAHGAAILAGAIPLFAVPIAAMVLGERLSVGKSLGLLAIVAGIVFLIFDSFTGFDNELWRGDVLFLGGALAWAAVAVLARAWRVEPVRGTAIAAVISMIVFVPIHFAFLPTRLDVVPLIDVAGQAVFHGFLSMVISMLLFTRAVSLLGASLTTMITALVPATAAVAAAILLDEPLSAFMIAAIVLTTAGMLGAVVSAKSGETAAASPAAGGSR